MNYDTLAAHTIRQVRGYQVFIDRHWRVCHGSFPIVGHGSVLMGPDIPDIEMLPIGIVKLSNGLLSNMSLGYFVYSDVDNYHEYHRQIKCPNRGKDRVTVIAIDNTLPEDRDLDIVDLTVSAIIEPGRDRDNHGEEPNNNDHQIYSGGRSCLDIIQIDEG